MDKMKVLVADPIAERGVEELAEGGALEVVVRTGLKEDQLLEIIPEFSALVVRSQTKANARVIEAGTNLKAIGRAGVGVDNIDVDAATRRGIIVMNTPAGNTISTAEHAFSLMMSLARNIPQAHGTMVAGKWDRKSFQGVELNGKTLGVVGLGRIGGEFARRAMAFGMRVVAYDPYLSATKARSLQVEIAETVDELMPQADFITLHVPSTPETRHILDARRLALAKKGVRIVNCARGGLIDEAALADALRSGQVAGAALDVYETEPPGEDFPLRGLPNVVMTPHLGASTAEAQELVGIEVAIQIRDALLRGEIRNAVNVPSIDARTLAQLGPFIDLGTRLGKFLSQISPKRREALTVSYSGKFNEMETGPVTRAVLRGFLATAGGPGVNEVNAPSLAASLGLEVSEKRLVCQSDFTEQIDVAARSGDEELTVSGTCFGSTPRLVAVNGRHVEAKPEGVLLLLENRDVPGIVGAVGTLLGKHGVNIAGMSLSRNESGGVALTILNLDSAPGEDVLAELLSVGNVVSARTIAM